MRQHINDGNDSNLTGKSLMLFKREYFTSIINYIAILIIILCFAGCKEDTYISSNVTEVEISSSHFWILQSFSTNNDDVAVVVLEEDSGDHKMFMNLKKDSDGSLIYNSPTISDGRLEKKGVYIVKEKQLVYLPAK